MAKSRFSLHITVLGATVLTVILIAWLATHATVAGENGRHTASPYLIDLSGQYVIRPLLTVGDEVPLLAGAFGSETPTGDTLAMAGIPDGLGVYETAEAYYLFVNHEFGASETSKLSSTVNGRINGARVSLFQFSKEWQVVGGKNLIETAVADGAVYTLDLVSGNYVDEAGHILNEETNPNFSRFCSGYLATDGFVGENGAPIPVWFAPEERGSDGRGWAVTPDGTATAIDGLGRYSKEQVYAASQYRAANAELTVLLSTEDFSDGEIYMYVGQQTAADPNGFAGGDLYVLRVEDGQGNGYDQETMPEDTSLVGRWTPVPGSVALSDGETLSNWVNESGRSTNFGRPEDIHEDPNDPGTFYFVTTGHGQPDNRFGKVYRFTLNPNDPTAVMDFEFLLEGGPDTGVSYDNITVDTGGRVLIQEDRTAGGVDVMATQQRHSRVLAYDISRDSVHMLWEVNQGQVDPSVADDYGNWESSGIVEVAAPPQPGRSSYLLDVQAHSLDNEAYVQGGQLLLVKPMATKFYLPAIWRAPSSLPAHSLNKKTRSP